MHNAFYTFAHFVIFYVELADICCILAPNHCDIVNFIIFYMYLKQRGTLFVQVGNKLFFFFFFFLIGQLIGLYNLERSQLSLNSRGANQIIYYVQERSYRKETLKFYLF